MSKFADKVRMLKGRGYSEDSARRIAYTIGAAIPLESAVRIAMRGFQLSELEAREMLAPAAEQGPPAPLAPAAPAPAQPVEVKS